MATFYRGGGFWKTEDDPNNDPPVISDTPMSSMGIFVSRFRDLITAHSNNLWFGDDNFYLFDMKYGFANLEIREYLGCHKCLVCGCEGFETGSSEYVVEYKGETFMFPEGYLHYITKHNVHPTEKFIDMILNFKPRPLNKGMTREQKDRYLIAENIIRIANGMAGLSYSI